ncbi:unnamed protein product [Vitrella brassicaformis CCMP3155]|uniref:Sushi domain-containing protein n=4 Tax=Vitrella brassicaformis TaxID=1169539 RepID=A0A0G4EXI5_VITBC|nr:unnamed protein product [Vitrella brassicaformis CCMP3155]|eukprot:CEM03304.1 unnamed protein product [Vitrella brassicaformis CCMP3155]
MALCRVALWRALLLFCFLFSSAALPTFNARQMPQQLTSDGAFYRSADDVAFLQDPGGNGTAGRGGSKPTLPPPLRIDCQVDSREVVKLVVRPEDGLLPDGWKDPSHERPFFTGQGHPPTKTNRVTATSGRVLWLDFGANHYFVTPFFNATHHICIPLLPPGGPAEASFLLAFHFAVSTPPLVGTRQVLLDNFQGFQVGFLPDESDPEAVHFGVLPLVAGDRSSMVRICWRAEEGLLYHARRLQEDTAYFVSRCGDGKVEPPEECDTGGEALGSSDCSCNCRKKCPPYASILGDRALRFAARYVTPHQQRNAQATSPYGFTSSILVKAMEAGGALELKCREDVPSVVGDKRRNRTFTADVASGRDIVICGASRSGEFSPRLMDCYETCDPDSLLWWQQTDIVLPERQATLQLVSPRRAGLVRHGEAVRVRCNPSAGVGGVEGAPSEQTLECDDGHLEPLRLPCFAICPAEIRGPPTYTLPISPSRYSISGEGFQEGATRTLSCRQGFTTPTDSTTTTEEIECIKGQWTPVTLVCEGQCPPFALPRGKEHLYVTDPPLTRESAPFGSRIHVYCARGLSPPSDGPQSLEVECTCYGTAEECQSNKGTYEWTDFELPCGASCPSYQTEEGYITELPFALGAASANNRSTETSPMGHVRQTGANDTTAEEASSAMSALTVVAVSGGKVVGGGGEDSTAAAGGRAEASDVTVPEGTAIVVACDAEKGYGVRLGALHTRDTVTCTSRGYSAKTLLYMCLSSPPLPDHLHYLVDPPAGDTRTGPPYPHGYAVTVSCRAGSSRGETDAVPLRETLTCVQGRWTEPNLVCRAKCMEWSMLDDAVYETLPEPQEALKRRADAALNKTAGEGGWYDGAMVKVKCRHSFEEQDLYCRNAHWTPLTLVCTRPCPKLSVEARKGMESEKSFLYVVSPEEVTRGESQHGTVVTVRCNQDKGFSPARGPVEDRITCNKGHWTPQRLFCGRDCPFIPWLHPPEAYLIPQIRTRPRDTPSLRRPHMAEGTVLNGPDVLAPSASPSPPPSPSPSPSPSPTPIVTTTQQPTSTEEPSDFAENEGVPAFLEEGKDDTTDWSPATYTAAHQLEILIGLEHHPSGTQVFIKCNGDLGYSPSTGARNRVDAIVCEAGKWTQLPLTCMPSCGPFPSPEHSHFYSIEHIGGMANTDRHGAKVRITCSDKYAALPEPRSPGFAESVCFNGTWRPFPPPMLCSGSCAPYALPASQVLASPPKAFYSTFDTIDIACNTQAGYLNASDRFTKVRNVGGEEEEPTNKGEGAVLSVSTLTCLHGLFSEPEPPLDCRQSCSDFITLVDTTEYSFRVMSSSAEFTNTTACALPPSAPSAVANTSAHPPSPLPLHPRHGSCVKLGCQMGYTPDVDPHQWSDEPCASPGDVHYEPVFGSRDCETLRCMDGQWRRRSFRCRKDCPNPFLHYLPEGLDILNTTKIKDVYHHGETLTITCHEPAGRPLTGYAAVPPELPDSNQTLTCNDGHFDFVKLDCKKLCGPYFPPGPKDHYKHYHWSTDSEGLQSSVDRQAEELIKKRGNTTVSAEALKPYLVHRSVRYMRCADLYSDPDWPSPSPYETVECVSGLWTIQQLKCTKQCPGKKFYYLPSDVYPTTYTGRKGGLPSPRTPHTVGSLFDRSSLYDDGDILSIDCIGPTSPSALPPAGEETTVGMGYEGDKCDVRCTRGKWTMLPIICKRRCHPYVNPLPARAVCEPPLFCKTDPRDLTSDEQLHTMHLPYGNDTMFRHGSALNISCIATYLPSLLPVQETITCSDGRWAATQLTCWKPCGAFDALARSGEDPSRYLSEPDQNNLNITPAHWRNDVPQPSPGSKEAVGPYFLHGSRYVVSCDTAKGFESIMPRPVDFSECFDGHWTGVALQCRRRCGSVESVMESLHEDPSRYTIAHKGVTHGTVAHLTCAEGYTPVEGRPDELELIECNDGQWGRPNLRCEKKCPDYMEYAGVYDSEVLNSSRYVLTGFSGQKWAGAAFTIECAVGASPDQPVQELTSAGEGPQLSVASSQVIRCLNGGWQARLLSCLANCPDYLPEPNYEIDEECGQGYIVTGHSFGYDNDTKTVRNGFSRELMCCLQGMPIFEDSDEPKCSWDWSVKDAGPNPAMTADDPTWGWDRVVCHDGQWTQPQLECHPNCVALEAEKFNLDLGEYKQYGRATGGRETSTSYDIFEEALPPPPREGGRGDEGDMADEDATGEAFETYPYGTTVDVRCDKGSLPDPVQGEWPKEWDKRVTVEATCKRGRFQNIPFDCIPVCPFIPKETDQYARYTLVGTRRTQGDERFPYEYFSKTFPWLARHGSIFYTMCTTPKYETFKNETFREHAADNCEWNAGKCLNRMLTEGRHKSDIGKDVAKLINPVSSPNIKFYKKFWPNAWGDKLIPNGLAKALGDYPPYKKYQCFYGTWLTDSPPLTCAQSIKVIRCIDQHATVWRLKKGARTPPSVSGQGFLSLLPLLWWLLKKTRILDVHLRRGLPSALIRFASACMERWPPSQANSTEFAEAGKNADGADCDGLFCEAEVIFLRDISIGDTVLSWDATRRRHTWKDVYFKETFDPPGPSDLTPTVTITVHRPRTSLTLSPSHLLPVVVPSTRHRTRLVAASEVRVGDMVYVGGKGGDAMGRVAGVKWRQERRVLSLMYVMGGYLVANGIVISDADEPLDLPTQGRWTAVTNLDTRLLYLVGGAAAVDSWWYRAYWRWSVRLNDGLQALCARAQEALSDLWTTFVM